MRKISAINYKERLDICKQCPKLVPKWNYCEICKCYMPLKVRVKKAKCPIGLWGGDHAISFRQKEEEKGKR